MTLDHSSTPLQFPKNLFLLSYPCDKTYTYNYVVGSTLLCNSYDKLLSVIRRKNNSLLLHGFVFSPRQIATRRSFSFSHRISLWACPFPRKPNVCNLFSHGCIFLRSSHFLRPQTLANFPYQKLNGLSANLLRFRFLPPTRVKPFSLSRRIVSRRLRFNGEFERRDEKISSRSDTVK